VVGRLRHVGAIAAAPVPTTAHRVLPAPDDYFVNDVVQKLLGDRTLGRTRSARYDAVFTGGLTITTTLDPRQQALAHTAVRETLPDSHGAFTAALVAVEPATGAVRALVGGPGFERSKYNIATQGVGRQVGSSMKPFVLAAALEQGISPKSTILGSGPCSFRNPGGVPDPYKAENYEGERAGVLNLYDATRHSINCAYLRLGQLVGLDNVVSMAHRLGVTAHLDPNLSLPLGTSEIHPIDMASAYATFADGGIHHEPYYVQQILDRHGKVLFRHRDEGTRVISREVAAEVTDVLRGVVTRGTGTAARFRDGRPAAGKTGTTSDHSDAWFIGYTPQLATAVWMGSPVDRTEMRWVGGVSRVTGGTWPARIWQAFMGPALAPQPVEAFAPPTEIGRGRYLRLSAKVEVRRWVRRRPTTTVPVPVTTAVVPPAPPPPSTGQTEGGA
jgi:penicillin-binding protein 1A